MLFDGRLEKDLGTQGPPPPLNKVSSPKSKESLKYFHYCVLCAFHRCTLREFANLGHPEFEFSASGGFSCVIP